MADASFLLNGNNVLADPNVGTNSSGGYEGGGTLTINSGRTVFQSDDIVEILVDNVTVDGEITGASRIVGLVVYDNGADYLSGTPLYTYTPMNPGQYANIQSDVSGLGDSYLRFNANVLVSSDPGAPRFNQLIAAAGTDLTGDISSGPITLNRLSDNDYDNDGIIDVGTTEDGNGAFNAENNNLVPVCFARGTLIETDRGPVAVERLRAGDMLRVMDGGLMPVLWIGSQWVAGTGAAAPVRIQAGALDNRRDLYVSQNHRMLVSGAVAELLFGEDEVLVAAKHLANGDTIRVQPCARVEYFHILLQGHQIILAEGCPSESFFPGDQAMSSLDQAARDEVLALFPALALPDALSRRALRSVEARVWRSSERRPFSPAGRGVSLRTAAHSLPHPPRRATS